MRVDRRVFLRTGRCLTLAISSTLLLGTACKEDNKASTPTAIKNPRQQNGAVRLHERIKRAKASVDNSDIDCDVADNGVETCVFDEGSGTVCTSLESADGEFVSDSCDGAAGSYSCAADGEKIVCVSEFPDGTRCEDVLTSDWELISSSCADLAFPGEECTADDEGNTRCDYGDGCYVTIDSSGVVIREACVMGTCSFECKRDENDADVHVCTYFKADGTVMCEERYGLADEAESDFGCSTELMLCDENCEPLDNGNVRCDYSEFDGCVTDLDSAGNLVSMNCPFGECNYSCVEDAASDLVTCTYTDASGNTVCTEQWGPSIDIQEDAQDNDVPDFCEVRDIGLTCDPNCTSPSDGVIVCSDDHCTTTFNADGSMTSQCSFEDGYSETCVYKDEYGAEFECTVVVDGESCTWGVNDQGEWYDDCSRVSFEDPMSEGPMFEDPMVMDSCQEIFNDDGAFVGHTCAWPDGTVEECKIEPENGYYFCTLTFADGTSCQYGIDAEGNEVDTCADVFPDPDMVAVGHGAADARSPRP